MRTVILVICLCFIAAVVYAGNAPEPIGLSNAALGGGRLNEFTPGVDGGKGLHNVGLLVKCWGKVTAVDPSPTPKFFYVNDGSAPSDTSGFEGVRVAIDNLAAGNSIGVPTVGHYLLITGISSTSSLGSGRIIPTLRPRKQTDVVDVSVLN